MYLYFALPRYLGAKPFRLLPPYQRLRREAEVGPAMGCSGFRKSLVKVTSFRYAAYT